MRTPKVATVEGNVTVAAAATAEVLASPGTGKKLIIIDLIVTIHTIIATGKVVIDDGTTDWFGWDAITAGSGQPPAITNAEITWTEAKALNVTTTGNCVVFVYAKAEIRG